MKKENLRYSHNYVLVIVESLLFKGDVWSQSATSTTNNVEMDNDKEYREFSEAKEIPF